MANALGTLFGDIANAIRTKTGDTATMKPIDFPTKIMEIEGGGGGGSLPAGIYLQYVASKPKNGVGRPFVFNNSIHILTKTDGAKELLIYKLENNAFTSVATYTTTTSHSLSGAAIVVLNGKVHIIVSQYHYVWDGSTIVAKSNAPIVSTSALSYACAHNGELYWTEQYKHNIYVWNETTDTWTEKINNVGNGTFTKNHGGIMFSHGDELYYATDSLSKGVYRIIDETPNVEVVSTTLIWRDGTIATDSGAYCWNGGQLLHNGGNLGLVYNLGTYAYLVEFNGELYVDGGSKNYYAFQKIHIIEETE